MMDELPLIPTISIKGVVETITFANEETGYTVAKIKAKDEKNQVIVVGSLPGIQLGETLSVTGTWTTHPQFGRQLEIKTYRVHPPETPDAIKRYLSSGLLKGVGKVTAERITDYFGEETLKVLDGAPERLVEVPKIGRTRARQIHSAWQGQKQYKDVMFFLQQYGVGVALAVKVFKQYGERAIAVIKRDPYQLVRDIVGVGFLTADRIALEMGIPNEAPARIQAGLVYALESMSQEGHCYASEDELVETCAKLINLSPDKCRQEIEALLERKSLLGDRSAVYLPYYYMAEMAVADGVVRLIQTQQDKLGIFSSTDWQKAALTLDQPGGIQLTAEQMEAVKMVFIHKVGILTGGPGTGKSSMTGSIIRLIQSFGYSVLLAAPTGRAAKRLSEATGLEAMTIHRLLEYTQKGNTFTRNRRNPLKTDLLIIDETSMADIILMNHLVDAISEGTHLLLIGDADQLPSVGPGNVLRDLIDSDVIPVICLSQIFRQSENSFIIENAHRINQGKTPEFPKDAEDFFLFGMEDAQKAEDWIVDIVMHRLPARFGLRPKDIQVLSPMYRGPAGVSALNQRIQAAVNPQRPEIKQHQSGEKLFREGDRVMQIRNNYDKLVYNGDIGVVSHIDSEDHALLVSFEGRQVTYEFSQLDELLLAYAISIHKSQGSEFPVVVLPVLTSHYIMLQRNLIYTAITRAKDIVVLVGSRRAISIAVNNNQTARRNTRLGMLLKEKISQV